MRKQFTHDDEYISYAGKYFLCIVLVSGLASGCATAPMPQTAEEYRQIVAKDEIFGTLFETYEVNQPYSKVAATLKAKAKECLDLKLAFEQCIKRSCQDFDVFYTPTVLSQARKTELHVQWRRTPENAIYTNGKPPAKGPYILVADAVPAGNGKTRMNIYTTKHVYTLLPPAIKHWASGTNMGCPNLAQSMYGN